MSKLGLGRRRWTMLVTVILALSLTAQAAGAQAFGETVHFGPDTYVVGPVDFDCIGWGTLTVVDERGVLRYTVAPTAMSFRENFLLHWQGRLVFEPDDPSLPTYEGPFSQVLTFQGDPEGSFGGTLVSVSVMFGDDGSRVTARFVAYFRHNALQWEPVDEATLICH
ncbi:MAG: hypothetical protein ACLGHX_14735 [Acidimicrobiia bacterium]